MTDYFGKNYEDEARWQSYYCQVREVTDWKPENVLEIGKGSGLVSTILKSRGIIHSSLDISPEVQPDIVGSVLELPMEDSAYDVTLCAEVLEHLPWEDFSKALSEIKRVTRRGVVLSLPHWGWMFQLRIKIPLLKRLDVFCKLSGLKSHSQGGDHYWEIGKKNYPLSKIVNEIESAGFSIRKTYMKADAPYHRFFILDIT